MAGISREADVKEHNRYRLSRMHCLADVALTPVGPSENGIEEALASCIPVLEKSGLPFVVHHGGFTIDAEWKTATDLIGQLHQHLHDAGFVRVHSDIRIGTRIDKAQTMQDKVDTVERKLVSEK